jgi:hypothetical protein
VLALAGMLFPAVAVAQPRIYFPSPDAGAAAATPGPVTTPAPAPATNGGWVAAGSSQYGGVPAAGGAAGSAYAPPGGMTYSGGAPAGGYGSVPTPGAPAPGVAGAAGAPAFGPAPTATLSGTIQPPGVGYDPYGAPVAGPAPLLPQDPYLPSQFGEFPGQMFSTAQKFRQSTAIDYHWFAGSGGKENELGINDVELTSTFAIPFFNFYNADKLQSPLLITPGFAFHFWDGPRSVGADPAELPPETYDAFLDTAWNPMLTQWFSAEMDVLVGVFSDYRGISTDAIRIKGRGMGVIRFSDAFKIKLGVWYLDRVRVKMLPAGGIVWQPNPETRFDILFPNPRFTQKLPMTGSVEWWWYISGEYGGGVWQIARDEGPAAGALDLVDYNDIRVALGLEFKRMGGLTGWFETGFAFERELRYRSRHPEVYYPDSTFFLRAGMAF